MKKLGLLFKETSQNLIKKNLQGSDAVFIIKYSGLTGPDLNVLRQSLKNSNANFFVVKNSVARRVFNEVGMEQLINRIEGPCGLVFVKDEPVNASRALFNFVKNHEKLILDGGYLKDKIIERKDIEAMSKLPSKEVLRALVVAALNSPISGLVITLNQVLSKFVYCLDQIKQKKSK